MCPEDCFLPSITQVNNCYLGNFLVVWWTMFEKHGIKESHSHMFILD